MLNWKSHLCELYEVLVYDDGTEMLQISGLHVSCL